MTNSVMAISRRRQWGAWQFGRRHSGLFSGSSGSYPPDDDDERRADKALKIFICVLVVAGMISLISPQVGGYIFGTMIWLGIIGCIIKIFFL